MKNRAMLSVLIGVLLPAAAGVAQTATGRVIGTVTDPQGGVVPNVKIVVTNTETQVARETTTGKDGYYQVLDLPIGFYSLTAEAPGFARVIMDTRQLFINASLRFDVTLMVGAVSETVQVESQTLMVESVNSTLGQSVTTRPIQELPLNGRNVIDLALYTAGVTPGNPNAPFTAGSPTTSFSIGGGRTDAVTYLLDGGLNNNLLNNGIVYNPNPDTVAEFRILTSNYNAEFGRNGGGIISVVTRSGSNAVHGSLFEFVRNDDFNANLFFNNANGVPRPILKRNQFGGTVGGPVFLPKVINGKDHLFWFFGYQGTRLSALQQNPAVATYTPAELNGDFSHAVSGGPDPKVAAFLQKFPFYQPNPALAAQAIIDPTKIGSTAQAYIKAGLIPTSPTGILFPQGAQTNNRDEYTAKFDLVATDKDRVAVTLGYFNNPRLDPFSAEATVPGYPTTTTNHQYFGNVAYTRIFSPAVLNDLRITAQRNNNLQFVPARSLPLPSALGIGIISDHPTGPPQLRFNSGLRVGFSRNGPTDLIDNTYAFSDTLTWTKGAHSWKWGFFYSPYQDNTVYDFYIDGRFRFLGRNSGTDLADFLFGLPDTYLQFPQAPSNIRTHSWAGFAQDEWHVRRNLTLTLGIRYEYNTPKFDTQGRSFSVIPGMHSQRFPNAPTGLVFPGDSGVPKGANFPDRDDWAPRVGFAWDVQGNGMTSLRGGFGVFYDVLKGEDNLQFNGQAPFFGFTSFSFPRLAANPTSDPGYFANPFQVAGIVNPFPSRPPTQNIDFAANGFLPFGDAGVYFVDPNLQTPYTFQYNLSLQRQLPAGMLAEIGYIGSDSHKLTALMDDNPFVPGTKNRILNPATGSPLFSFLSTFSNVAKANYNALVASLQKRYSSTLLGSMFFNFNYTYSHNIDNASGFREFNSAVPYFNHKLFRGNSDTDLRHVMNFTGGWELPFDRAWDKGPKRLTSGWSLYPIVSWRTGFAMTVYGANNFQPSATDPGPTGAGDQNLILVNYPGGSVPLFDPHHVSVFNKKPGNYYFDPTLFTIPTSGYGNLPRNALRGPGQTNFDLTFAKATAITERAKMEFRADFFNILNHTEFKTPSSTGALDAASGTFGLISTTYDPRIIQLALRFSF